MDEDAKKKRQEEEEERVKRELEEHLAEERREK